MDRLAQTALSAIRQMQDLKFDLAHNLSNVNVPGFRRDLPNEGNAGFLQTLEAAKLRSDAQDLMADAPAFIVSSTVISVTRTLLGTGLYRNGYTVHCTAEEGYSFRVMLKPCERPPAAGERFDGGVLMHDWDVALKQAICLEA